MNGLGLAAAEVRPGRMGGGRGRIEPEDAEALFGDDLTVLVAVGAQGRDEMAGPERGLLTRRHVLDDGGHRRWSPGTSSRW